MSSNSERNHGDWIGDWLLVFGEHESPDVGRGPDRRWAMDFCHGEARLWRQEPTSEWKGSPWRRQELEGGEEGISWLHGELYGSCRDQSRALAATVRDPAQAAHLNGHYLLLVFHRQSESWSVLTNRLGTQHVYVASQPSGGPRLVLGSSFRSVAAMAGCRELDWPALTCFFAHGFLPGDQTHLAGVKILRPASWLRLDSHGRPRGTSRYWSWWHLTDEKRDYGATVEDFAARFSEVTAELSAPSNGGRVAIPISGGLDSRSTVAALPRTGDPEERFWFYSYGYGSSSVETRIARAVARSRRFPLRSFDVESYLFPRLTHVLSCVEGFQDVTQSRQATVSNELTTNRADAVLAAHWGDVWLDDLAGDSPETLRQNLLDKATKKFFKPGGWLVDQLCSRRLDVEPAEVARTAISSELDRLSDVDDPAFRLKALKTDQWSFRWTVASLRMYQAAAYPRLPFYDNRLVDFFCTVPAEYLRNRRLQVDYLKRYAPDLARVTWQEYDTSLFMVPYFNSLLLPKRAIKKIFRLVSGRPVIERNWEVQFSGEEGRRGLERWLLEPGLQLRDYLGPQRVESLLRELESRPTAALGYTVSMLLTFSSWLESMPR